MGAWYCTREDVRNAVDAKDSVQSRAQIDRAVEAASRSIEGQLKRKFYPLSATRYFDWPNRQYARPWRLWLNQHELVSVSALVVAGTTISASDYFLRPDDGPPYTRIEINLASKAAFAAGSTYQRAIALTGVFGHSAEEEAVGSLAANLGAAAASTASVTWTTARIGVGDILRIDSERVIVTERTMINTAFGLQAGLTASVADRTVSVTSGAAFAVDEVLLIGSERMRVTDIAGNTLTVERAYDGTTLAAHSNGASIYALTGVELSRGQLGTTAAAHNNGATIYRHLVPGLIKSLCVAESITLLQEEGSAYVRVAADGETAVEGAGQGLSVLRSDARATYGRRARMRAV